MTTYSNQIQDMIASFANLSNDFQNSSIETKSEEKAKKKQQKSRKEGFQNILPPFHKLAGKDLDINRSTFTAYETPKSVPDWRTSMISAPHTPNFEKETNL